jgi:hypothetical protein
MQQHQIECITYPKFMNNFAQTINYMASAIEMITRNSSGGARQIANFHRGKSSINEWANNSQGRPGRGRGRNKNDK